MKKLLVVADHCVHTGFARVSENLCARLRDRWEIYVVGLNYQGIPHNFPYPIWPARNGGDIWGLGMATSLMNQLKPDAMLVINDPWILARFATEVERGDTALAGYMPVDAKNISGDICQGLSLLDAALFYTQFGYDQCYYGLNGTPVGIIPHGVDSRMYKPILKAVARRAMRWESAIPSDSFIVGCVNRNQMRKRLDLTIEYFAEWVKQYKIPPNVYLYIHCAQRDSGWNLEQLAYYYGISNRLILQSEEAVRADMGLPEQAMSYVYSSMDVHVSTTEGEGWGLPVMESMACGIPQIVPAWSALNEWAAGAVYLVPCSTTVAHILINTIGGVPDKTEFVKALDRFYREPELREKYSKLARVKVSDPKYSWDHISDMFDVEIGKAVEHRQKSKPLVAVND